MIEGTYVLVEGDFATMLEEISFKDGTATMMSAFGETPGVHYEVRGRTIYIGYSGMMQALFEIIDADTIQSDIPGFSGVYKRR